MGAGKRVVVFNSKGGVGKTTTTLNLGAALQRAGGVVRLVDLDPQGHLTRIFGLECKDVGRTAFAVYASNAPLQAEQVEQALPEIGSLVASHGNLMKVDSLFGKGPTVLNKLRQGLDSLDAVGERTSLVDCCPYIGVLSLSAIFAAETVLIPVSTDYLSLQGAQQITRALKALEPVVKRRVPRRYVLTRYDRRRKMSADIQNRMREEFGVELCQTLIGENVAVAMSPALGKDVFAYQSDSNGARDYQQLFEELHAGGVL